jgi:hypothetical protein
VIAPQTGSGKVIIAAVRQWPQSCPGCSTKFDDDDVRPLERTGPAIEISTPGNPIVGSADADA